MGEVECSFEGQCGGFLNASRPLGILLERSFCPQERLLELIDAVLVFKGDGIEAMAWISRTT
jgi:hypothetical protein